MKRLVLLGSLALGTAAFAGCAGGSGSPAAPIVPTQPQSAPAASSARSTTVSARFLHVCDAPVAGEASCHSIIDTETGVGKSPQGKVGSNATTPSGYGPLQLETAYGLPTPTPSSTTAPTGPIIGIVDAYDAVTLENDLGVYRSQYGLPPCTTANKCFLKVGQTGTSSLPKANASWEQETSLDVDMVSANCPTCRILVVEANSASFANLGASVNTAINLGAYAVSNSYGGSESSTEGQYASYYNHPGHPITASSGDSGYGAQSPASFNTIVATGGTSLTTVSPRAESVWNGAGSGCSKYETQLSWQGVAPENSACTKRVIADTSYDADPNTGVAVYDSTAYRGSSGWLVFGGTSVASPAIAAIYGLANDASGISYPASKLYTSTTSLNDVTTGSNGSCGGIYLCTGEVGYDGPTGLGTPHGFAAF